MGKGALLTPNGGTAAGGKAQTFRGQVADPSGEANSTTLPAVSADSIEKLRRLNGLCVLTATTKRIALIDSIVHCLAPEPMHRV